MSRERSIDLQHICAPDTSIRTGDRQDCRVPVLFGFRTVEFKPSHSKAGAEWTSARVSMTIPSGVGQKQPYCRWLVRDLRSRHRKKLRKRRCHDRVQNTVSNSTVRRRRRPQDLVRHQQQILWRATQPFSAGHRCYRLIQIQSLFPATQLRIQVR